MLDQETKRRINSARDTLVGKIPDPKSQIEQITTALIYKFMDDMDRENEEIGRKATFLIGDLADFAWGKLMSTQLSGEQRWELYSRALTSFAKSAQIPELFRTIFKASYLPFRDPQTLNLFLKDINGFQYDHSERLGDAFEYLLSIMGSQGDAGQFRTPRHIIDFIVEIVAPQKNETILDPACGTAGFLISAYKHIKKYNSSNFDRKKSPLPFEHFESDTVDELSIQSNGRYKGDQLAPDDRKRLVENICGYDISPEMVRLALVNLYLHDFKNPQITEYDSLTYEDKWDETFDVILANPPFMTPKGGIVPHQRFSVQAKRAEVLFVDYIAEHLTIKGRAGIIVPEGIIFQAANAYKSLRKNLIENWGLYAVVSLPSGVFQPYSGVKTSVLLLDKTLAKKCRRILFVKVKNDGFDLGAQRRKIDKNDLPQAFRVLQQWQKKQTISKKYEKLAHVVSKKKIAENGEYNLTGDRYREAVDYSNVKWEMVELGEVCEFKNGLWKGKKEPFQIVKIIRNTNFGKKGELDLSDVAEHPVEIKQLESRKLQKGDIVLENSGGGPEQPVGRVIYFEENDSLIYSWSNFTSRIRIMHININSKYLYLFLNDFYQSGKTEKFQKRTSGIRNLDKKLYQKIKIPLPPLEVQQQIVTEIEQYQKVIDGAKQVVKNWKPSFRINPDWKMVALSDVCEINRKTAESIKLFGETDFVYIDISSVGNGTGSLNYDNKISTRDAPSRARRIVQNKDVLLSTVRPNLRAFAYLENLPSKVLASTGFAVLTAKVNVLAKYVFYLLLFTDDIQNQMASKMGKGAYPSINQNDVEQLLIPLPPLKEQNKIVTEIESEQKAIEECKKLIKTMEQKIETKISEVWGETKSD